MKEVIVTGGAGFIGSNLVERLLLDQNTRVSIFDNLSTGKIQNLPKDNEKCTFYNIDLVKERKEWPQIKASALFHLAANADVRGGQTDRQVDYIQNVHVTKQVCDYARDNLIPKVVFSSSATVYGEPDTFPTPETALMPQTSVYGASKLAGEAYIQAYANYGDFSAAIFRFVSWTGPRYSHGVIYDFFNKLEKDSSKLTVLGDGSQAKSFLHVADGVDAIISISNQVNKGCEIINLGNSEIMKVRDLAKVVIEEMELKNVDIKYTGGKRGWLGDAPLVQLDIAKALKMGWTPKRNIATSIRDTVQYLKANR